MKCPLFGSVYHLLHVRLLSIQHIHDAGQGMPKSSGILLAQGSLVEEIEKRIPHADQLSPEVLLREIDTWDEKFRFGVVEVDG